MLFVLQIALIAGLLRNIAVRRRAESLLQLSEERCRLAQDIARFSRAATVSELTSSLAHELNQPLAAILANAQAALSMMGRGVADPKELREIFDDIVADNGRATEVIRSMRSKLKMGATEHKPLLLNDVIREIIPIVRNEALLRNISIDLELGPSLHSIMGDRVQIRQVIVNIVFNAFEAMDASERPRRLVLKTRQTDKEVALDVEDSGTGIPLDKLTSIFEPFITTKPNGLGLGLSLSRSIVIGHNGRLWAENNSAGGAIFHLVLPAEEALRSAAGRDVDRIFRGDAGPPSHGVTVLLADDREPFRHAVSSVLMDLPELKLLAEAANGGEAVEKAAELKPDLVLLDIGLPVINGVEAAAKIRSVAPGARILFLTQHDSPDFVRAAMKAGALGYVLKTDAGSELLSAAIAVLRGDQYISSGIQRKCP